MMPAVDRRVWTYADLAVAFRFAHDLFKQPTAEQYAWLRSDECDRMWRALAEACGNLPLRLPLPENLATLESQYIATYDVGEPTPLVPLLESHYNHRDPVPRILHENILFYRRFGLELRSSANETADHLRHQLEFVAYVCELATLSNDRAAPDVQSQIELALGDYVSRHLLSWLPQAYNAAAHAPLAMAGPCLQLSRELCVTFTQ